jgi:hypothetical protein
MKRMKQTFDFPHFVSHSNWSHSSITAFGRRYNSDKMSVSSHINSYAPPTPAKSIFTGASELDFDENFGDAEHPAQDGEDAVHFVLLAEFDIDAGATLTHQYPYPTGTDEQYVGDAKSLGRGLADRTVDWQS